MMFHNEGLAATFNDGLYKILVINSSGVSYKMYKKYLHFKIKILPSKIQMQMSEKMKSLPGLVY